MPAQKRALSEFPPSPRGTISISPIRGGVHLDLLHLGSSRAGYRDRGLKPVNPAIMDSLGSATPFVRLTQEDVRSTDLHQPGTLKKLLRKLNRSGKKRRSPGAACTKCRRLKIGCDGSFPCGNCVMAGETCIRGQATSSESANLVLWSSPESPIACGLMRCRSPKAQATDPMLPSLGGIGMLLDLGFRADCVANMIGSCPRKLRSALDRLSCAIPHMLLNQAAKRKPLPELDAMFESTQVVCTRHEIEPDGSSACLFNDQACSRFGVHKEEFAARMAGRDMPLVLTEYRTLCFQLDLLHQMCFNESGWFDLFQPFCSTVFIAGGQAEERWHVHRGRCSLYATGFHTTAVLITAEEFDRGVAQRRDALGLFPECAFSGAELLGAKGLLHREKIATLAAEAEGRRMLEALADRVLALFSLDAPPPPAASHPRSPAASQESRTV